MKPLSFMLAIVGFMCFGLGAEQATAQGNGTIQQDIELDGEFFYNACCGEWITLKGTLHQWKNAKTGKFHFNFKGVEATGSNGSVYHGNLVGNDSETTDDGENFEGTEHSRYQLSSKNGCKFIIHIISTYTYSTDTGWEFVDKKFVFECEGDLS